MQTNWSNRPNKKVARRFAVMFDRQTSQRKHVLTLPADRLLCVQQGISDDVFSHMKTHFTLVERNKEVYESMISKAESLGIKYTPFLGEMHSLVLTRPVDFAFLDFNGQFTKDVSFWIKNHLSKHLSPGADVSITVDVPYRGISNFMKIVHDFFQLKPEYQKHYHKLAEQFGTVGNATATDGIALIEILFDDFEFDLESPPWKYGDSQTPMLLYRLFNLKPKKSSLAHAGPFFDYIQRCAAMNENTKGDTKMSSRVKKRNGRLYDPKVRSEAAKKSWETRRANNRAVKRRAAAKKAWKTRRLQSQ